MRTPGNAAVAVPNTPTDGRTSGRISMGTPKNSHACADHRWVRTSSSIVRLALVTSVTCRPPVRFQISQVSIVPNSTSPRSARSRRPGMWLRIQFSRGPEKYVASGSPLRCCTSSAPGVPSSVLTSVSVRVSCHTTARPIGTPVCRSHSTVVSRWLAMPRAATSSVLIPARLSASGASRFTLRQISAASCSTQPGRGKYCLCSCWARETSWPRRSKTMHRVDVVPWSIAMT